LNIADEKPEGTIFVIPLRLDECVVPRRLRSWQYAEYFPKEERARAYQRLLISLRMRARKLDISTLSLADQLAQREAEERARLAAEEKARKEKEEKDRKAAEEKERLQAERKAKREREAKEKKEAEAKAKKEKEDQERKRAEKPAESAAGVGVGGDVKDSNIVTGDHNVIVQFAPSVAEKAEPSRFARFPARAPVTREEKNTPSQPNIRPWFVLGGLLILVVLCGFGITYLIQNWPAVPAPTQNSDVSNPEPGVGSTWTSPKDGMVMMFVPAGTFTMGSGSDEHEVTLADFWIDKTEVTNAMYANCVGEGKCDAPNSMGSHTRSSYYGNLEFEDFPVIYVSWYDAKAYCEWRGDGTHLPTEAEWEKAASWDDTKKEKRVYPWGDSISCSFANYRGKNGGCIGDTTKVGSYPSGASFYGLLDMAGNVWEWVSSLYQSYPYSPTDGREDLSASGSRVLRGGSWNYSDGSARSANRSGGDPTYASLNYIGFRCSRSLP
jgi:formylglycine-generating enzyme required for sulfatase activity